MPKNKNIHHENLELESRLAFSKTLLGSKNNTKLYKVWLRNYIKLLSISD